MVDSAGGLEREIEREVTPPRITRDDDQPTEDECDALWRVSETRRQSEPRIFSPGGSSQARALLDSTPLEAGRAEAEQECWATVLERVIAGNREDSKPLFKQKQSRFEEGRDWFRFIRSFELIVGPRKFSVEKKVYELVSCLGDKALDMFSAAYKPQIHSSWDSVLQLCQEMWSGESVYDRATRELDTPVTFSDTIQGYWQEKIKFAAVVNPSDPERLAKSKFFSGLPEKIRLASVGFKEGPAALLVQVATTAALNCDWKHDLIATGSMKRKSAAAAEAEVEVEAAYASPKSKSSPRGYRSDDSYYKKRRACRRRLIPVMPMIPATPESLVANSTQSTLLDKIGGPEMLCMRRPPDLQSSLDA